MFAEIAEDHPFYRNELLWKEQVFDRKQYPIKGQAYFMGVGFTEVGITEVNNFWKVTPIEEGQQINPEIPKPDSRSKGGFLHRLSVFPAVRSFDLIDLV